MNEERHERMRALMRHVHRNPKFSVPVVAARITAAMAKSRGEPYMLLEAKAFLVEALAVAKHAAKETMRDYFKPLRYWQLWLVVALLTAGAMCLENS